MIFDPIEITEGGNTFKRLTSKKDFWAVEYDPDTLIIENQTIYSEDLPRNGAIKGGNVADGSMDKDGFGCNGTYKEFEDQIEKRKLVSG